MVQLLADKLHSLTKELEFDWQKEANFVITVPPVVPNDQDALPWKQYMLVTKAKCFVALCNLNFNVINIEKLFLYITENLSIKGLKN
jgi:hypothetical protein